MDNFSFTTLGPFALLEFEPWKAEGFIHGFIGAPWDFVSPDSPHWRLLEEKIGASRTIILRQTHSTNVVVAAESGLSADGMVLPTTRSAKTTIFGIRTADCLPVLIKGDGRLALVHAGWRGLSGGILEKAVESVGIRALRLEVVIGPAAGAAAYEVGKEVVESFSKIDPVCSIGGGGKFHLALAKTAERIILQKAPNSKVAIAPFCTISDPAFYSHRRDPRNPGRNLAFIAN